MKSIAIKKLSILIAFIAIKGWCADINEFDSYNKDVSILNNTFGKCNIISKVEYIDSNNSALSYTESFKFCVPSGEVLVSRINNINSSTNAETRLYIDNYRRCYYFNNTSNDWVAINPSDAKCLTDDIKNIIKSCSYKTDILLQARSMSLSSVLSKLNDSNTNSSNLIIALAKQLASSVPNGTTGQVIEIPLPSGIMSYTLDSKGLITKMEKISKNRNSIKISNVLESSQSIAQFNKTNTPVLLASSIGELHNSVKDTENSNRFTDKLKQPLLGIVIAKKYGYAQICAVLHGSSAEKAGLRSGMRIIEINKKAIGESDLNNIYEILSKLSTVELLVMNENGSVSSKTIEREYITDQ